MRYKPELNRKESIADSMQLVPKECTFLDLSRALLCGGYEDDHRAFAQELASTLPFIPESIETIDLSDNVYEGSGFTGVSLESLQLILTHLPSQIKRLILKNNELGLKHLYNPDLPNITLLSAIPSNVALDTLILEENNFHIYATNDSEINSKKPNSDPIKLQCTINTIIFSADEIIRMTKPELEHLAQSIPWGCGVWIQNVDGMMISSVKTNYFKQQIVSLHQRELYDLTLAYLSREKNLNTRVVDLITSYLYRSDDVNLQRSAYQNYSRIFFSSGKTKQQEREQQVLEVQDIYTVTGHKKALGLMSFVIFLILLKLTAEPIKQCGYTVNGLKMFLGVVFSVAATVRQYNEINSLLLRFAHSDLMKTLCNNFLSFKVIPDGEDILISFNEENENTPRFDWKLH